MTKKDACQEFVLNYVLTRASAVTSNFHVCGAVADAFEAWGAIKFTLERKEKEGAFK